MSRTKVLKVFPDATIETRKGVRGDRYYLVRERFSAFLYIGQGNTPAAAWRDAWLKLEKKQT